MKSNYFKYLFIIFAIGIMIFAFVKIKNEEDVNLYENVENVQVEENAKINEFKLGVASFDSMNPILSQNKNIQDISKIIYEPLVKISSEYKAEMCLAKEVAKQNETTYIIKLNDDIKWSNGDSFNASDVKFTIDRLKDSETIYKNNVEHVIGLEIIDNYTLIISLDKEVPFFEYNLTFPILSNKFYNDKEFIADIVPVGTGMYKVSEVKESSIILEKNPNYKQKDSLKLDKITITIYSTVGELYNAFKIGNVDFISTQNSKLTDYIGTIGYYSKEMKGREHDFLAFNCNNEILSQTSVRRAIAYSIDKTNIVSSIYEDKYYVSSFPLDYGNWLYQEKDASLGYNTEQAKQILIEDGWFFQNKYWQKVINYRTYLIKLNLVVKNTDEKQVQVAENIKFQLENQGFRINIIKTSNEQYIRYLENKNYDIILCSMNLSVNPDLSTFFGENNMANYINDEVVEIINKVKNTQDEAILKESYKRLGEIYKIEIPYVSLYNNKYIVAYNVDLVGTVECNWFNQFYNICEWHK